MLCLFKEIYWSVDNVRTFQNISEFYTYSDFEEVYRKYYFSNTVFFALITGKMNVKCNISH